jgi:cystathionine beta-lyase
MFRAVDRSDTYTTKYDDAVKKFGTDDLLPLWVADMDLASPKCVQETLAKRAAHPIYGYTVYPQRFYDAIQRWFEKRYHWQIEKEWIVPCYGVVPSMNFALDAYTKEGDGVIVQTPVYPPFVTSVKHKKRKVLDNTLVYKHGRYAIDFEDFELKAKDATLFLLCSPHNPTARVWRDEELERLIAICLEHDVTIVSDEIHADIVYGRGFRSLGSFEAIMKKCVVLNAPSKTFNIAGLNTSYAIIPDVKLRHRYISEQKRSGVTNGTPFGIEALMTAYEEGESWLEALEVHLEHNIDYVNSYIEQHGLPLSTVPNEATFLMWIDCRGLGLEHEALKRFFYDKAKLGLNDGLSFGEAGDGFMRLNVGTGKEVLEIAMQRLHDAIKDLDL